MSDQHPNPEPTAYELAVKIAQRMTGPSHWNARRHETMDDSGKRYAVVVRVEDGAELGVTVGGYRTEGRVTFRAHWPKYKDGNTYTPREYFKHHVRRYTGPQHARERHRATSPRRLRSGVPKGAG